MEPVVILGAGLNLPLGVDSPEKLFDVAREKRQLSRDTVLAGRHHATEIQEGSEHAWKIKNRFCNAFTEEEYYSFDPAFFQISGKVTRTMQIEQMAALHVVYRAIEDAGITLHELHRTTTGIFVAAYSIFAPSVNAPDETTLRGSIMSTTADQVAYFLGTHGPSVTLETACSSSLVALAMAVASLQKKDCDTAIVVGHNGISRRSFHLALQACGVLVEGPTSHPFDEDSPKGFMRAEGCGAVVLRRLSDAEAAGNRIRCEIAGALAGSAGAAETATLGGGRVYEQPCGTGMREMFLRAARSAGVAFSDVDYLECHATGTAVGDVIELDAIASVYGDAHSAERPLRVASVKSNIGHAEIAAGMFSMIKSVESLERRVFLPTAGVTTPRKDFDWKGHHMVVQQAVEPFPTDKRVVIACNSFGIGGSYAHVLLREYQPSPRALAQKRYVLSSVPKGVKDTSSQGHHLFPLSAFSLPHLKLYAGELAAYLRYNPSVRLTDVCGTMALRRTAFSFRKSFVTTSTSDLAQQLEAFSQGGASVEPSNEDRNIKVLFVLTGQGSQWAKNGSALMAAFPTYRMVAERVDALFRQLSGWSILEKIETMTTEDMRDTQYAQPITFLVQVALLETLKSFKVFPDMVMGHSAGEVAAAYAACTLTLEEAVKVVYHRSQEQQTLAGSGRMLAVAMGELEIRNLLKSPLELACVNSPSSVVVAGPEEDLKQLKLRLPDTVSASFIPGNIAFHSSRVEPILPSMRSRLSFLEAIEPSWALPIISTVTGRFESLRGAQYWCDNVRQPVLFQAAVETAFSVDPAPEVVIEIGPHRTLVGPLMQTLDGMVKSTGVTALSLLNRREPSCVVSLLKGLGTLVERGLNVDLKGHFELHQSYRFEPQLPKHPYIKKHIRSNLVPVLEAEGNAEGLAAGPAAGHRRIGTDSFMVELSDRTLKTMMEHRMGGESIVPGSFYSEMAVEAAGGLPVTLTDVEYKSKLPIPKTTTGDSAALVTITLKEEQDNVQSFVIKSCSSREKTFEDPVYVEHCVGKVVRGSHLLTPEGEIRRCRQAQGGGVMTNLEEYVKDLGCDGLKRLREAHAQVVHESKEVFYGTCSAEGKNEYGPHYQLVNQVSADPVAGTLLARLDVDNSIWERDGGIYAPELLDNLTHVSLCNAEANVIYYAGGYDAAHFLRKPTTTDMYALWTPDREGIQVGRRKRSGHFSLYDGNGKLLLHIHNFFCLFVMAGDSYKTCDLKWQPFGVTSDLSVVTSALKAVTASSLSWTSTQHEVFSAWLAKRLHASTIIAAEDRSALSAATRQLALQASCGISSDTEDAVFSIPGLTSEKLEALVTALFEKLNDIPSKTEKKGEEEPGDELSSLSEEEMAALTCWATRQGIEADAVAEALISMAVAEQHSASSPSFVLRILEVAETADCPTVADRLVSLLSRLPEGIMVEYFLATHSSTVLRTLGKHVIGERRNVRLRRVLLPCGSPSTELQDLTFHALIVDDWVRTGMEACGGSAQALLSSLHSFLAPSSRVMVRGFNPVPAWVRVLSFVSPAPLPLHDAERLDGDSSRVNPQAEWLELLGAANGSNDGLLGLVVASVPSKVIDPAQGQQQQEGFFLLAASSSQQAESVSKVLLEKATGASVLSVIVSDSITAEDLASAVAEHLTTGEQRQQRLRGIVFAAGLGDRSMIGEQGFSRLMRFSQALIPCEDFITKLRVPGSSEPPSFWVLTEGAYVSEVGMVPGQGTLQGLTTVLASELRFVATKHLDMADSEDMGRAAELVVLNARERTLAVTRQGVRVPRFTAVNVGEARSEQLSPSDKRTYYATVPGAGTEGVVLMPPGVINVDFRLRELPQLAADEVMIEIEAAALNFRDVMISMSMLPEQSYERSYFGKNLGMEAAGIVSAVGSMVTGIQVGDRVGCSEPGSFGNRIVAKESRVMKLQDHISMIDAAATQSVYNTCEHALINLAHIRKGDRVLIHSAAGGIGLSAISICQYVGAEIYATAGTEEKRELVRQLGVKHVFDSRSTSWYESVMDATGDEGVDVVLNSLAGTHQRLGMQVLRSSGRFCEIGKVDIFANNNLGLLAFRKNISFFAVDMDRLALDDPKLSAEVTRAVSEHFLAGHYKPLPVTTFPMGQLREALEYMKTGKHVGKVLVVNHDTEGNECPVSLTTPPQVFRPDVAYLITGGAGGFGGRLVRYAFKQGARHFIVSTTKADTESVKQSFRDLFVADTKGETTLQVVTADTSKVADIEKLLAVARVASPPVKAVFHVAGVSGDVKVAEFKDGEDFERVAYCKALGAWHLSEGTKDMGLEHFVTVSSIAALTGGMGNAAYAAANAFLDSLTRARRVQGLPGTTFNMSSLSDVGILVKNLAARKFQMKLGVEYMTSTKALEQLELGLAAGLNPVVTMFFKEQTRTMFPSQAAWSHLLDEAITLGASAGSTGQMTSIKEIVSYLVEEVKSITQAADVQVNAPLVSLGLDSFGFLELGGRIQKTFGIDMSAIKLTPEKNLTEVAGVILKLQRRAAEAGDRPGAAQGDTQAVRRGEMESELSRSDVAHLFQSSFEERFGSKSSTATRKHAGSQKRATFLLGGTGIAGAHILRYLIKGGAPRVYCLVRAGTAAAAVSRIKAVMKELHIWKDSFANCIVGVPGDLVKPQFGMTPEDCEEVARHTKTIVHSAGARSWSIDEQSVDCNIRGLMSVVAMAKDIGATIHYVSSCWLDLYEAAEEKDKLVLAELPYVIIKRRGEEILHFAARQCGVPCIISRLPLLSVNSRGGFVGDFFLFSVMQAMSATGCSLGGRALQPLMTSDAAGKEFVRHGKKNPPGPGRMLTRHSAAALAEWVTVDELCDMVDSVSSKPINREATNEEFHRRLGNVLGEDAARMFDMRSFNHSAERAGQRLVADIRKNRKADLLHRASTWKANKVSAATVFRQFLRDHPEMVTDCRLAQVVKAHQSRMLMKQQQEISEGDAILKTGGDNMDADSVTSAGDTSNSGSQRSSSQ